MDTGYEALAPGVAGSMCVKCRQIKPLPQFKRTLTKLQAQSRGYKAEFPVEIESSMCKACQPRRKSESDLTIRELYNRAHNGDIHPLIAGDKIAKRKRTIGFERSKAARSRWNAERDLIWRPIRDELAAEITKCVQQAKHIKAKHQHATPALLAFMVEHYLPTLRTLRAAIDVMRYTNEQAAPHADWQSYAEDAAVRKLRDAWDAVPLDERTAVRKPPALIVWRAEMAQPAPSAPRRSHLDTSDRPAELPSERRRRQWRDGAP